MHTAVRAAFVTGPTGSAEITVVVLCAERLVRDAVVAALGSLGFDVTGERQPSAGPFDEVRRRLARTQPTVGVLVTELDRPGSLHDAAAVVREMDLPWLLLTTTPPGPAWGALIDVGAREVMDASTSLTEVGRVIGQIAHGKELAGPEHSLGVRAWQEATAEHRDLARRLSLLTAREMAILVALHDGVPVATIAARDGVAVSTVRGQVRSILHKLEVRSQVQAGVLYGQASAWLERWPSGTGPSHAGPESDGAGGSSAARSRTGGT